MRALAGAAGEGSIVDGVVKIDGKEADEQLFSRLATYAEQTVRGPFSSLHLSPPPHLLDRPLVFAFVGCGQRDFSASVLALYQDPIIPRMRRRSAVTYLGA